MMPTLLREVLGARTLPREPEPDLVMDGEEQVRAYAEAGRIDGVMAAAYLFHSARVSQVIAGRELVVDLGCGPATQLAQIAEFNPDTQFLGIDLSEQMLADAQAHVSRLGLDNVRFEQGDITRLEMLADHSVDAVISTMALHHLPTLGHLERCFAEIQRVRKADSALYLTDFTRLKSLKSVIFFAYLNRRHQPHLFSLDYERSLRAAFQRDEFQRLAGEVFGPQVTLHTTHGIPILGLLKTADQDLPAERRALFRERRRALPAKYRRELDDIRLFFWLGGLRNDPFRA